MLRWFKSYSISDLKLSKKEALQKEKVNIEIKKEQKEENNMTATETESKVKALEKSLEELQNVIRKLAQENNSILTMLAKLSDDVSTNKANVDGMKKELQEKAKKDLNLGRTNYV